MDSPENERDTLDSLLKKVQAPSAQAVALGGGVHAPGAAASPALGSAVFEEARAIEAGGDAQGRRPRADLLRGVHLKVKVELGRARLPLGEALELGPGSVVDLDKLADDPVDLYVNDLLIARGEVLVVNDCFCVRITEVFSQEAVEEET